jgi:hypothetical protein
MLSDCQLNKTWSIGNRKSLRMAGRPRLLPSNPGKQRRPGNPGLLIIRSRNEIDGLLLAVFKSFHLWLNRRFIRPQTVTSTQLAPSFVKPGRANHSSLQRSFQLAAHLHSAPRNSRLHCSNADLERGRHLFVAKTVHVAQDDGLSIRSP